MISPWLTFQACSERDGRQQPSIWQHELWLQLRTAGQHPWWAQTSTVLDCAPGKIKTDISRNEIVLHLEIQ